MERHEEMLSPEEQYAQLAPTLDADGFSLYAAAEEITGLKVYEEFPYEDNRGMFEMADGHTLLRYLEAAYFGTITWEIVPGTPYERAILGEVDKTTPEYRTFYQKICAGAAAHIKKRIGKETQNVKEPISEINKESFWDLIHDAKIACGQDMDVMLAYLKDRLVSMGPTQAQNFHDIIHAYEDLADKFGLWDAAGIMKEYGCSDDGFIDFRAWLIAQGREVYFAALADPDSLADVVPYGDCCFEQLSYVGDYAYEQLTGKSAYSIAIRKVSLFPQGYAAVLTQSILLDEPSVIVADIGGWTVDLMRLDNRIPNASTCRSLELGMIRCLDEIGEQIRRTLGLSMTAAQMESVLRGDAVHINEDARKIIDRQADAYVHRLLSAITESGLDTRAMPAVFLGGGAAMLKRNVSAADGLCRPVILDDVSLNAKGYERLAERLTKNDEQ